MPLPWYARITAHRFVRLYAATMSHTYARNYLHLIFATKLRCRILKADAREIAHNEIRRAALEYQVAIDTMGGTEEHVHLLVQLPPKIAAAVFVRALKAKSSKAMNDRGYPFSWQEGYGCFSVSTSNVAAVRKYIEGQESHHRKRTFDEEFALILDRNGFPPEPPREEPSSCVDGASDPDPGLPPGL